MRYFTLRSATFRDDLGYQRMNTFLKAVLLILVAVLAVKFLPAIVALGFMLALSVVALGAVGVSLLAAVALAVTVLVAVLAPLWVPVLMIVGVIVLIRRSSRRRPA